MHAWCRYIAAFIAATWAAGPAAASSDLVREFAVCTGRMSAEVEHSWILADGNSDRIERIRDGLAALLESVTDPATERQVMAFRLDAKFVHKALLETATFSDDRRRAEAARRRAEELSANCVALLLV